MRILVTGARGMLGTDLCVLLKQKQISPIELDLPKFDITNINQAINTIKQHKPEIIIHLAAFTDVDRAEENKADAYAVNTQGTWAVALAAQECKAKLLYISTDYVFDGSKNKPYHENDQPNPINYYGLTKLLGERAITQHLKQYYIVRTAWLFGKNGNNFVKTIIKLAQEKDDLEVVNDQIGSPTYTKDLSQAIYNLIQTDKYGIYHITNAGYCSWYEFACEIIKQAELNTQITPVSSDKINRKAKRPAYSVLDNHKYEQTCQDKLRSWQEALRYYLRIS
ncbi:MAG: dTDP-4-dehydrorhamnose reductase [candidate division WOR-3 bacterium]